jgi:two-component system invasion response regulator UvrY
MMPRMAGLDTLTEIRRIGYSFPVLVLTMHKEPELLCRTFFAGATGYMLKDGIAQELVNALNTVLERKVYLSPSIKRELPVTCRLSPHTGQQLPSNFGHCSQSKFC